MSDLVTLSEIEEAARRLVGVAVRTPLVRLPGTELSIKPESLQPIGAFKIRGAYAAMTAGPVPSGVVAHSSGNHAQAVAYAARELGIPAVLVIPHTAPELKVQACLDLGAEVVLVEPNMEARVGTAARLAEAHGYDLIPPFDDLRVIAGQATIGLEIVADDPHVDVVLVPVGGGGLIAGVATAVKLLAPRAKVIGVEPSLAADARESLRSGVPIAWDPADTARTMADALRAERVGDIPFRHILKYVDDIITVTEEEIFEATRRIAAAAHLIAEPAGAVATAAYLSHRPKLPDGTRYTAILSGGNTDPALLFD
ncbi:threonine/serine dehydratase [Actinocorallia sp. A-T 12471]|uniref:threonine ammonia-lyase n=1 Tax=Actinocorallia sp. A-T 12471 TaxID=3089813 RepID=UPI0029CCA739|nr:threonine/serine dehydratase [Actinocorallia sp. A-T 12471]MDX6741756.1 threonine/serine dehydratase [Actinocorallia sp. A-T 12471]